jgi:hypothetical protein
MDENELKLVISRFSGNIQAVYNLTRELYDKLGFDLDFNFESSNASQRFTNLVRNMVGKGLVQKPAKLGRTLIFDERSFLQLIVARKYLGAGCSMLALAGYLVDMPTDEIYERLFAKQLPDIDKVARRNASSLSAKKSLLSNSEDQSERKFPLYHHIKIKPGLFLQAQTGKFTLGELDKMASILEKYVNYLQQTDQDSGSDDSEIY